MKRLTIEERARAWDDYLKVNHPRYYSDLHPQIIRFADILQKEDRKELLDIGCGPGRNTVHLAERFNVTAMDISEKALEICAGRVMAQGHGLRTILGNQFALPFPDNCFSAVLSAFSLNFGYLDEIDKGEKEMFRVLEPGGLYLLAVLSDQDPRDKKGEKVEEGTFQTEDGLVMHYFSEKELEDLPGTIISKEHSIFHRGYEGEKDLGEAGAWFVIGEKEFEKL